MHVGNRFWRGFALPVLMISLSTHAQAADGTWNVDTAGNWSTAANWASSVIADGSNSWAYFTNNITAARVVTLDSARTIGNLKFQDAVDSHAFTLSGANILTLDSGTGISQIMTTGNAARVSTISVVLAGTNIVQKTGNTILTLSGLNTFSGGLDISTGTVDYAADTALGNSGNTITFSGNAALRYGTASMTNSHPMVINASCVATVTVNIAAGNGPMRWDGPISGAGTLTLGNDTGVLELGGTNTFSGGFRTAGSSSTVRANDGVGMPTNSNVLLAGGEWQSSANITRANGTNPYEVQLTTSTVGFGAKDSAIDVNLGGGGTLTWGTTAFNPTIFALNNVASSDQKITVRNAIDLKIGSVARTIRAGGTAGLLATAPVEFAGPISSTNNRVTTSLILNGPGLLIFSGTNSFSGSNPTNTTQIIMAGPGTLRADDGVGMSAGVIRIDEGFWESGANITRAVGTAGNQVRFPTAAAVCGFSAAGNDINVNLGGAGATLTLASGNTALTYLGLNSPNATHKTTLANGLDLNAGARRIYVYTNVAEITGNIVGTGSRELAKYGAGTLILSGAANTYDGTNSILEGTLQIDSEARLGNAPPAPRWNSLRFDGGVLRTTADFTIDDGNRGIGITGNDGTFEVDAGTTLTIANAIAGQNGTSTTLHKRGGGTLVLDNITNNFGSALGTVIAEGTVVLGYDGSFGTNTADVCFNGNSTLLVTNSLTMSSARRFAVSAGVTGTVEVASGVTLTLPPAAGTVGSTNSIFRKTGPGTLQWNFAGNQVMNPSCITLDEGTWDLQAFSDIVSNVVMNAGSIIGSGVLTGATFSVSSGTISANLGGWSASNGALTKSSTNTVVISGITSYSGASTINAGSLTVNGTIGAASAMAVNSGGTLNGTGTVAGSVTVNAGGTVSPGASVGVITNGNLVLNAGSTNYFEFKTPPTPTQTNDQIVVTGTLTINGGAFYLVEEGTSNPLTTETTYYLIAYTGAIGGTGVSALSVTNAVGGKTYTFDTVAGTPNWVTLTISSSKTWDGEDADDNLWNSGDNWSGNTAPGGGTALTFAGTARTDNTNNIAANTQFPGLTFDATAGTFVLRGNTLNLTGDILNDSANTQTLNLGLVLDGNDRTLDADAGAIVLNSIVSETGGARGVIKTGASRATLAATNTFTGAVAIQVGPLKITAPSALGTVAGASTVASGAALEIEGGITTVAEPLTLNNQGISTGGALRNTANNNEFAGVVTLASQSRVNSDSGTLTLSGGVGGSGQHLTVGGAGNVTVQTAAIGTVAGQVNKDGSGTLTLAAASTYTGLTTVSNGVVTVQNTTGLGTIAAGVRVESGAALQTEGTFNIGAEPMNLTGAGIGGAGALRHISGVVSNSGVITLAGTTRINSDSGRLAQVGTTGGAGQNLTLGGAGDIDVRAAIGTTTGTLTKDGAGTVTLSAVNTFTGLTLVQAGTLQAAIAAALSTGDLTVSGGTYGIQNFAESVGTVTLQSGFLTGGPAVLTSTGGFIFESGTNSAPLAGSVGITKQTAGTVLQSGAGTFTGPVTVNAGTLVLGSTTALGPAASAKLHFGPASSGKVQLNNLSVTVTNLAGDATAIVENGGATTLSTLSIDCDITTTYDGVLQDGTGGFGLALTKITGLGTLVLSGANTYSGATLIDTGILQLGAAGVIPNGTGKGNVTITTAGADKLDLNGFNETINGLLGAGMVTNTAGLATFTLGDGNATASSTVEIGGDLNVVKIGDGTITLGGDCLYTGTTAIQNGVLELSAAADRLPIGTALTLGAGTDSGKFRMNARSQTISQLLTSGSGTSNRVVNGSATATVLTLATPSGVTNTIDTMLGGPDANENDFSITKTNAGTVILSGANTFGTTAANVGITTISAGTLSIDAESRLGTLPAAADADRLTLNGGNLAITDDMSISLNRGITIGTADGTINVAATKTLTVNSLVTATPVGCDMTKTGTGTLTLSANTATEPDGRIFVTEGILKAGSANAMGNVAAGGETVVSSGATFDVSAQTIVLIEPMNISGTGVGGVGAIHDSSGLGSTLAANIGLLADSSVGNTGGTLLLSGIISNAFSLTKVGAGTITLAASNTYSGGTIVSGGTLQIGNLNNRLNDSGSLTVTNGATFGLQTFTDVVGPVTLYSGSITGTGTGTLTGSVFNVESGLISAKLSGPGVPLNKSSSGTVTLSGANSYTGPTAVNAGTLVVNGTTAAGSTVTVASGATLKGSGHILGTVTIQSSGIYEPGTSIGTITNGTLDLDAGSINNFEFTTGSNDQIYVTQSGGLTIDVGAGINLYEEGGTTAFATNGQYMLINYVGALNGNATNFVVLNPQGGKDYQFTTNNNWVLLDINNVGGLPEVANTGGATNLTAHSATLQGEVVLTGGNNPAVYAFWGLTDGGTTKANWSHTNSAGTLPAGNFSVTPANWLTASTTYYYRIYGTNVNGEDWADYTTNFTTTAESGSTEVAIDDTLDNATAEFGPSPSVVFTSDTAGYVFYVDAGGTVSYRKSLNGGVTWGSAVNLGDNQGNGSVSVWYDQWTPGGTGTRIHIAHVGSTGDDLNYNDLDTATDTAGTWKLISNGTAWSSASRGNAGATITKTTDGRLFGSFGPTGVNGVVTPQTNVVCWSWDGVTWATNNPTAAAIDDADFGQLLPLSSGDILLLQQDSATGDEFRSAVLSSNGTWSAWSSIAPSAEDTIYLSHFGASVDKLTGDIYLTGHSDPATAAGDLNAYKFSDTSRTWSTLTQVVEDSGMHVASAAMLIDANNGNLYAVYAEQDGTAILTAAPHTTNVFIRYKRSLDSGLTWSAATTISTIAGQDVRGLRGTLTGSERLYAVWYEADDNDMFGNTVADLSPYGLVVSDVTVIEGNAGTTNAMFTVSMAAANPDAVTVNFATADGTAKAGAPFLDYVSTNGTLSFSSGVTSLTVTVVVNGDTEHEGTSQAFTLGLSGASGAPIGSSPGSGTITDDDAAPGHVFVDVDATAGEYTGYTWYNAYTNLHEALTANSAATEYWVAGGTYHPYGASTPLVVQSNDVVYGGFAGTETLASQRDWTANPTVISGDWTGDGVSDMSLRPLVLWDMQGEDNSAVFDGFVVQHGFNSNGGSGIIGGGIGIDTTGARDGGMNLRNCIFRHNIAGLGGAITHNYGASMLENCLFYTNQTTSGEFGGAIFLRRNNTIMTIVNCTFSGNTTPAGTGADVRSISDAECVGFNIKNTIMRSGTSAALLNNGGGTTAITYSNVKAPSGTFTTANSIDTDPLFVNSGASNYTIMVMSPCLDTGTSSGAPSADLAGTTRPQRQFIDMGAYERDWTGLPIIANNGVGAFSATTAIVNASLISTGAAATTVRVYWGTTDGGTTPASWQYTNTFSGAQAVGALATNLTVPATAVYYFRYYATNSVGEDWALPSSSTFIVAGTYAIGDNMDFETTSESLSAAPGWYQDGGFYTNAVGGVTPHSGSYMFHPKADGSGNFNDEYQNFDLSAYTNAILAGAGFSFTGRYNIPVGSLNNTIVNFDLAFYNAASGTISTLTSGTISIDNDASTWQAHTHSGAVPTNAVSARIYMHWGSTAVVGGTVDGAWDNMEFDLTAFSSPTYAVSVAPNPVGATIMVDGASATSSNNYLWEVGSVHTIRVVNAVQEISDGVRYTWQNWSNGGAQTQVVTATMITNYTANFSGPELRWRWSAIPANAGTVIPASESWYASNTVFGVTAIVSAAGYQFRYWTGDLVGTSSNLNVTLTSPRTAVAHFGYTGAVVYVDIDATGGSGLGYSWANAFTNLAHGMDAATSNAQLWVAEGTYRPGTAVADSFDMQDYVLVYGGFAATETLLSQRNPNVYRSIVSGDLSNDDTGNYGNRIDNAYHVVTGAEGALLDGFVITGGQTKDDPSGNDGGGLFASGVSMTVRNCTFVNNQAGFHRNGGAAAVTGGTYIFEDCVFSDNKLYDDGGGAGIYAYSSRTTINRCRFIGGHEFSDSGNGGALYLDGSSPGHYHTTITNSLFAGNVADYAGAIRVAGTAASGQITNRLDMKNCTLANNRAQSSGGDGFIGSLWSRRFYAIANLTNCISYGNSALNGTDEIIAQNGGALYVAYSDVAGGFAGTSNINSNPLFVGGPSTTWASVGAFNASTRQTVLTASGSPGWTVNAYTGLSVNVDTSQYRQFLIAANSASTLTVWGDAASVASAGETFQIYDYDLLSGSPAKDTGIAAGAPAIDILGTARPQFAGIDMGAYESTDSGFDGTLFMFQ